MVYEASPSGSGARLGAAGEPSGPACSPDVWSGRASQEVFVDLSDVGLASMMGWTARILTSRVGRMIDSRQQRGGELCALDARGHSRFQLLQNALNKKAPLLYVVFDALFVDRKDIREKPLLDRKKILKALLPRDPLVRYSEHVAEFGRREFAKAQRADEEGVIAKRAAGLYYSGKRTREWLKFKAVHEQEAIIVGYTEPRRSRKYFGSLVLAVREKAKKRWVYAGHVGTGFDQAALKSLYETMQPLRTDKKPFDQKVRFETATTWLIPKLVCEVKFTEWTSEGEMRHPVFLGLRIDKKAFDVVREQA